MNAQFDWNQYQSRVDELVKLHGQAIRNGEDDTHIRAEFNDKKVTLTEKDGVITYWYGAKA